MQEAIRLLRICSPGARLLVAGIACTSVFHHPAEAKIVTFDPPGSIDTEPQGINARGWITGDYYDQENNVHGFLRAPDGTITTFDVAQGKCGTDSVSINRKGITTGHYRDRSCKYHGFERASDGTITTFDVSGSTGTVPTSINDKSSITGWYYDGSGLEHGFLRTADGTFTKFDPKDSKQTDPYSINNSGVIAGSYDSSSSFVRAVDGTIKSFNVNNEATYANCINDAGYVVGQYFTNDTFDGFLRTPSGGITTIVPNGTIETVATAINDKQVITGAYSTADGMQHGFVRSAKGRYTTFDPTGSADTFPESINKSGAITGWWVDSNSQIHGFLRTP